MRGRKGPRYLIDAMKRALSEHREVELYWSLHFALAMAQQTLRDTGWLADCRNANAASMTWRGLLLGS
ncbi:hypothetical protein [Bradyrhizobium sp. CCGUVB4N]|uniref:hypothetical protein n=1 Tax=Bradyrhizobium sp. CCGUVB4N TaxID=2949631 RepID=UPI0035C77E5C